MSALNLLLLTFASWRLAYMLVSEDGLLNVFDTLRRLANRAETTSELFSCVWCMSVWTSAALVALVLLVPGAWYAVYVLAVSAAAIIVHEIVQKVRDI